MKLELRKYGDYNRENRQLTKEIHSCVRLVKLHIHLYLQIIDPEMDYSSTYEHSTFQVSMHVLKVSFYFMN